MTDRAPLAHNTYRSGDGTVPVIIESPTDSHPSAADMPNWHEASDEEYAAYLDYWNDVYDTGVGRHKASDWAYGVGLPRYQADAFGEWFVEKHGTDSRSWPSWSTAKIAFDYDPRARELLAKYGKEPDWPTSARTH